MSQGRTVAALLGSAVAFGALVAMTKVRTPACRPQAEPHKGGKAAGCRAMRTPLCGPG